MDLGYKLKKENPWNHASIFSKIFFGWMLGPIRLYSKNLINITTLYKALDKDKSKLLADRLEKNWNAEVNRAKKLKKKPKLLKVLIKTFYLKCVYCGFLWFFSFGVFASLQPVIIKKLVYLFTNFKIDENLTELYVYSVVLVGAIFFQVILINHCGFGMRQLGMRIRVATSSLIYRKITRLNQKSLGQTAAGQIINLLSNDVTRFDLVTILLHSLWVMPIQVVIMGYFTWVQVGGSCFVGLLLLVITSFPLQGYLASLLGTLRSKISKKTDTRVILMSEILAGIRVIKMYAWEKPFEKVVKLIRGAEIKDISTAAYIQGITISCMEVNGSLPLCLTIICFILLGNHITADTVFSLSRTFSILQLSMTIQFPSALSACAETLISIHRLQDFLMMEEKEQNIDNDYKKTSVTISGVSASWTNNGSTLQDISLKVPPDTLCVVIGSVGAGKSSLLQLILGELLPKSGNIKIEGKISYSSQEPWVFQSTVRNNIIFGQPYEKIRYKKVVSACALERDFEQFPQGDKTIVGERGVSLSGGQRARINLARAIYRQADVYLLDDPLSAVDTLVGKHLFEECICIHLSGKIRILVTHQLQYLKKANLIVVINEGKIVTQGTFKDLLKMNLDFTKFLVDEKYEDIDELKRSRKLSTVSIKSTNSDNQEDNIVKEEESGGNPNSKPFLGYILSTRQIVMVILTVILYVFVQGITTGNTYWLAYWTNHEQIRQSVESSQLESSSLQEVLIYPLNNSDKNNNLNQQVYITDIPIPNSLNFFIDIFDDMELNGVKQQIIKTYYGLFVFGTLMGIVVILILTKTFMFFKMCMASSVNLHSDILHMLLQAPMSFFDTNPSGRILNRFSKDMGAIDEIFPRILVEAIQIILIICGILITIAISNPYLIIAIIILILVFWKFKSLYISTSKCVKHFEGITKSLVFSHVNLTLNGITTIRASGAEDILINEFDENQNVHSAAWFLVLSTSSCFGIWADLVCLIFITVILFGFVIISQISDVNGSLIGLAISQSIILIGFMPHGLRQTSEVINHLISVERVLQYTHLDKEGPFETSKDKMPKNWPTNGFVEFKNLSMKYILSHPPVLNCLNFTILPGQKIGIVGRTGAGKSSLIAALFRLTPLEGTITIDGIDTKELGLSDLRRKISIIPQEPVLFSATLRYNLDPFEEYDDNVIWEALKQVDLNNSVSSLDFMVSEGGANFSLGQRQLVCLARAALRNNKILVLDEATANVDHRTDSFIQTTIRKKFKDCTVLTIAHRLNTIMDSDKVLVMNFGSMVEFDHPYKLLQIEDGYFYKMVLETGPAMTEQLKEIAINAYYDNENNVLEA